MIVCTCCLVHLGPSFVHSWWGGGEGRLLDFPLFFHLWSPSSSLPWFLCSVPNLFPCCSIVTRSFPSALRSGTFRIGQTWPQSFDLQVKMVLQVVCLQLYILGWLLRGRVHVTKFIACPLSSVSHHPAQFSVLFSSCFNSLYFLPLCIVPPGPDP